MHIDCGTKYCIVCGEKAACHHGYVTANEENESGNLIEVEVLAGFCKIHEFSETADTNGCYGCYGKYDTKYGLLQNIFGDLD